MSEVVVSPHVAGYKLKPSSLLFIILDIIVQLDTLQTPNPRLKKRATDARELGRNARSLRFRWRNQDHSVSQGRSGARKTDAIIDNTLTSMDTSLGALARNDEAPDIQKKARALRKALFANGVRPVSGLTFEEQQQTVTEMLELLRDPFADHVAACGLTVLVDQLDRLNAKFSRQLDVRNRDQVEHSDVEAAEAQFTEAFNRVFVTILADYCEEPDILDKLLEQYADQQERAALYYERHGSMPDVDPNTGEPVDDDGGAPLDDADEPGVDVDTDVDPEPTEA
ncbi:hypothetical protein FIV42_04465 [Persicimonas caeni]|uniref:Uncharacterized protein n=1 Tax=Persicimonas caeni TaxID=2292766 RepID=A0A4Y6PPI2_PERCE|nr:DUF6261 family protein [Persicimonas caeni]QDG50019.1 hypothetical protein FIV42_04465 [Persicimonas caeni]QED31240.1 hypothetical protein FRD00_04460 [Persicimonas caeni]